MNFNEIPYTFCEVLFFNMLKPYINYQAINYKDGEISEVSDSITIEKALQISINGDSFAVVMQTPGDEVNLCKGLLFSEDIITPKTLVQFDTIKSDDDYIEEVNCVIEPSELGEGYKSSRSLLSVSSCGICGKQELAGINTNGEKLSTYLLEPEFIFDLKKQMQSNQPIFPITGSTHGSALFDSKGNLLALKEDVGRHNSLDKAIGDLLLQNRLNEAKILFFSGRLSFEIIFKSFRAKVPTIIAISAPTSLAIDYAKEFGITLYGFCRGDRFTKYS